jgi:hypothetical protein
MHVAARIWMICVPGTLVATSDSAYERALDQPRLSRRLPAAAAVGAGGTPGSTRSCSHRVYDVRRGLRRAAFAAHWQPELAR